uniref:Uncharacterized protein n=1 Tax=Lepeophtheirus salmonis TaxID=72036 RepID=A0A0K2V2W0_LEPSM
MFPILYEADPLPNLIELTVNLSHELFKRIYLFQRVSIFHQALKHVLYCPLRPECCSLVQGPDNSLDQSYRMLIINPFKSQDDQCLSLPSMKVAMDFISRKSFRPLGRRGLCRVGIIVTCRVDG